MFVMMNAARLQVGGEGVAMGEAAYQAALAFAKDRIQSRSLDPAKRDPNAPADNILVHPDVRRMFAQHQIDDGGPTRPCGVDVDLHRCFSLKFGRGGTRESGRPGRAADPDHQELWFGAWFSEYLRGDAGDGWRRLYPRLAS